MKQQVFTGSPDIDWLFSTHLQAWQDTAMHNHCAAAIVYGNEDSPERVELLDTDHYEAVPYASFVQNEQGNLVES